MWGLLNTMRRKARRRAERIRLLYSVALAVVAGLGVTAAAQWTLNHVLHIYPSPDAKVSEADIVRLSFTVVAGVGGVIALVIAYRRQRDVEQSRFVERFGAAATQLGDSATAIRIAGAYAMAGVADAADPSQRQQCIDVLCGYLRLPYESDQGSSGRTTLVTRRTRAQGNDSDETEEHIEYRQNDREVRRTILRIIADHLRPNIDNDWSAVSFDFSRARLEDVDLSDTRWGNVRFTDVTFLGAISFANAVFGGESSFARAEFTAGANFGKATFEGEASFTDAKFHGVVSFSHAGFASAEFTNVVFDRAAKFGHASFLRAASFGNASFAEGAEFSDAIFAQTAGFKSVTFAGAALFVRARFGGPTEFKQSVFAAGGRFRGAAFADADISFCAANFGAERVDFTDPREWNPAAPPKFDWDRNVATKPVNIEPAQWPPVATG